MASNTPNLSLRKPTNQDLVNVATDLSANFDKIDAHVTSATAHSGTYERVYAVAAGATVADVQAQVDAASAAGGGVVALADGSYSWTAALVPKSNVTLFGRHATVRRSGTGNLIHAATSSFSNFIIDGITFEGPVNETPSTPKRARTTSGTGCQTAVHIDGDLATGTGAITNFTMRNCTVQNCTALPIRIAGVRGVVRVVDCNFINNQDVGFLFCQEVIFADNHITMSADNGVSLSRGNTKVTCTGNTIDNCAYSGIHVAGFLTDIGPTNFTVVGNTVKNVGFNGIYADYAPKYGTIADNDIDCGYFRGPSDQASDANGAGIYLGGYPPSDRVTPTDWVTGVAVTGNHIRRAARCGIYLSGGKQISLVGNLIEDTGTQFLADGSTAIASSDATSNIGIYIEQSTTSTNVTVVANTMTDTRATAYANFAIVPQAPGSTITYLWNQMYGHRNAFNLFEGGVTRTWNQTNVFNQNTKHVLGATSGSNTGTGTIAGFDINGAAGSTRPFRLQTAGVDRWHLRANNTAEAGSNAGSDFELYARDDSGNALLVPITVRRSDGRITLAEAVHLALGTTTGTKIGTATTQKIGFFNATPIVQPAANPDTSGAALADLETEVNQLKALLRSLGLMAS